MLPCAPSGRRIPRASRHRVEVALAGLGADEARGDGKAVHAHLLQPHRAFVRRDGGLSREAVMTGSASRAASSTEVTLAATAASGPPTVAMSIAVGGGDDAEQPHPVRARQARLRQPDVQHLGDHRVGVGEAADDRVHLAGGDRLAEPAGQRRVRRGDQRDRPRRTGALRAAARRRRQARRGRRTGRRARRRRCGRPAPRPRGCPPGARRRARRPARRRDRCRCRERRDKGGSALRQARGNRAAVPAAARPRRGDGRRTAERSAAASGPAGAGGREGRRSGWPAPVPVPRRAPAPGPPPAL